MASETLNQISDSEEDPTAVSRKKDHITLAFASRVSPDALDHRFYYEPMLAAHPERGSLKPFPFLQKRMRAPIWVSSMTGGTALARTINHNLAKACAEFGLGMGLGSCRQLLYNDDYLPDFDVRDVMGDAQPLYANLGIAQLEQLLENRQQHKIIELIRKLRADGLIVHVNPLQEAMQPEGDHFKKPPIDTVKALLDVLHIPLIVKEVGQGFGPESLRALMQLPLEAIEFAAGGGTNFARLELLRSDELKKSIFGPLAQAGHHAAEMLGYVQQISKSLGTACLVKQYIISGGIQHFLDGYYLVKKSPWPAVYGQASAMLQFAQNDYETLRQFVENQIKGLELAEAFLTIK